ncbi:MFS transporter [Algihabitans albus]|uniref:MFS transporter n=1 Tax=Algihabitans albus TaxID=2164067 RepID=UPI000E5D3D58|nr:MFS transporter [Algihabitans albus]
MTESIAQPFSGDRNPTVRNVAVLAACMALTISSLSLLMTVSAVVGYMLAADPKFATFPLALQFLAVLCSTIPASFFMQRFGRRAGFTLGAFCGLVGSLISAAAVWYGSFVLLCVGSGFLGVMAVHGGFYRFAAADTASPGFRPKAISLVMAGGVGAAVLGPELAKHTRDLFEPLLFFGGFLAIAVLNLLVMALLQLIRIPTPVRAAGGASGRPLLEIASQPAFIVAVLAAMVGYGAMNLIMVPTPLAMLGCDHPFEVAAFVIQLHVLGMYAPSFFTGHLIQKFGHLPVLGLGVLLILGCVGVNLSGVEVTHFSVALIFLGLGWNFLYIGGTSLVTETYRPEEKAKVQALNDTLIWGTVAITAFSSGALYNGLGWAAVNLAVVVPLLLVLAALAWLGTRRTATA